MAKTTMKQSVRIEETGEVTTLAELDAAGRLEFSTCMMDGPKRNGERNSVRRYFADLKSDRTGGGVSGWEIGETAYKSRTGAIISIGEG